MHRQHIAFGVQRRQLGAAVEELGQRIAERLRGVDADIRADAGQDLVRRDEQVVLGRIEGDQFRRMAGADNDVPGARADPDPIAVD